MSNQKRGRDQLLAVKVIKMMCVSGAERVLTVTEPIETQSIPSEASALDSLLGVRFLQKALDPSMGSSQRLNWASIRC